MRHYSQLTFEERKVIQKMRWNNKKPAEIAKILSRHRSTITRELKRHCSESIFYRASEAQDKAEKLRKRKKSGIGTKIENNNTLFLYILEKLLKGWLPETIASRLKREHPDDCTYHVSHETIYLWIYKLYKQKGIELYKILPQCKKKRNRRRFKYSSRIKIKDRKSIHTRPREADARSKKGHWEGDLIVGKGARCNIVTLVDRKTRFLVASKCQSKVPDVCNRSILEAFGDVENKYIKTITFDNGSEFTHFKTIEEACECTVYFTDPYSSWQRGTNENTNRLIRRYFPKKTDFNEISEKSLIKVVQELNNRPRKVLNYLTPYEVFCNNSVALKT